MTTVQLIYRIALHIILFVISFYGLSALDFAKFLRPGPNRKAKAVLLLTLMAMALAYLCSQYILAISVYL